LRSDAGIPWQMEPPERALSPTSFTNSINASVTRFPKPPETHSQ
jgi:hypothetical protein